jgi:hypothetical protein
MTITYRRLSSTVPVARRGMLPRVHVRGVAAAAFVIGSLAGVANEHVGSALTRTLDTDDLVAALPRSSELPAGWSVEEVEPRTQFAPDSGPGIGPCGGDNRDARAEQAQAVAVATTPELYTPDNLVVNVDLYAFADADAAHSFVNSVRTASEACSTFFQYSLAESDVDIFDGSDQVVWNFQESIAIGAPVASQSPDSLTTYGVTDYGTAAQDGNYGGRFVSYANYEQHGTVVAVTRLFAECCLYGFSNPQEFSAIEPTFSDFQAVVELLRQGIAERLNATVTTEGAVATTDPDAHIFQSEGTEEAIWMTLLGQHFSVPDVTDYLLDNDCELEAIAWICAGAGTEIQFDTGENLSAFFMYAPGVFDAPYDGAMPGGITWSDTRADVEAKLGPPDVDIPGAGPGVFASSGWTSHSPVVWVTYWVPEEAGLDAPLHHVQVQLD